MHTITGDELAKMQAELVVGVGRDVVKLVDRKQPVVEFLDAVFINGEPERRVCANQSLVVAFEEYSD